MIKLLATSPTQLLVHVRFTIRASHRRPKRLIGTISALPARLKSQEYLAFKWRYNNLIY